MRHRKLDAPYRLGGMLAFSRAWSAAEVMPAKDTPRIV